MTSQLLKGRHGFFCHRWAGARNLHLSGTRQAQSPGKVCVQEVGRGQGEPNPGLQEVGGEEAAEAGANRVHGRSAAGLAGGSPGPPRAAVTSAFGTAVPSGSRHRPTAPLARVWDVKKGRESGRRREFSPLSHSPANFYSISRGRKETRSPSSRTAHRSLLVPAPPGEGGGVTPDPPLG